jgi:hypothetical protein
MGRKEYRRAPSLYSIACPSRVHLDSIYTYLQDRQLASIVQNTSTQTSCLSHSSQKQTRNPIRNQHHLQKELCPPSALLDQRTKLGSYQAPCLQYHSKMRRWLRCPEEVGRTGRRWLDRTLPLFACTKSGR